MVAHNPEPDSIFGQLWCNLSREPPLYNDEFTIAEIFFTCRNIIYQHKIATKLARYSRLVALLFSRTATELLDGFSPGHKRISKAPQYKELAVNFCGALEPD